MENIITAVTAQKKRKERVNVFIDEQYSFSLPAEKAPGLAPGRQLSPEQIRSYKELDQKQKALERALSYLAVRPRSCREIRQHLDAKGFYEPAIESAIHRLTELGYIDDAAFARMWIESRSRSRPRGIIGLRRELQQKGVSETMISDALQDFDEFSAALTAISGKLEKWQGLEPMQRRKKIYEFLYRRGFSGTSCREICGRETEEE
ncbi:MAG: RecX family transcriptional regulator [Desulfosalsimonadaceae bacterium]